MSATTYSSLGPGRGLQGSCGCRVSKSMARSFTCLADDQHTGISSLNVTLKRGTGARGEGKQGKVGILHVFQRDNLFDQNELGELINIYYWIAQF